MSAPFVDMAQNMLQVLNPGAAPGKYGWTMAKAVEKVSTDAWQKYKLAEWREVAVYLAMQLNTALSRNGDDERFALRKIESALKTWHEAESRAQAAPKELDVEPQLFGEPA